MCGIAGIVGSSLEAGTMQAVLSGMAHRGPDGQGTFTDGALTLLHTRLSIQDLSEQAGQPMISEDGRYVIVYNGELYNPMTIRDRLIARGQVFRSASDTETILYGFMHFGDDLLPQMNGIFAFAIYDKEKRQLFAARDPYGVKPFYYQFEKDVFSFASEIKTLYRLRNPGRAPDMDTLFQVLLLLWPLGEHTALKSVKKLLPGCLMRVDVDHPQPVIRKWSQEVFTGNYLQLTEQEWIQKLDEELNKAVRRQLLSDKPVAYFLSGGLDSSLLLAIARKINPGKALQAFTIAAGTDFEKEGFGNDLHYAKWVANHLEVSLDVIHATPDLLQELDKMVYALEAPQADIAPVFVRKIAQAAKAKGFDVLISGTGGDDIFSGYRRHQALAYDKQMDRMPMRLRRFIKWFASFLPDTVSGRRIKKLTAGIDQDTFSRLCHYFFWAEKHTVLNLFHDNVRNSIEENSVEIFFQQLLERIPNEQSRLNQILHIEVNSFLPDHNLNYTDKMGMAEGVEIRVPYLDLELTQLAALIPPSLKMKGPTTKYLLKKVAERYLPQEVIDRPKTGFGAPVRTWMRENISFQQQVWERLNSSTFRESALFRHDTIEQLYLDTISGEKDHSYTLFALLVIESWLRQFS